MRTACTLLLLLCLFVFAGTTHAAIYKWVDENGTITFRDTPPPEGVKANVVTPKPLSKAEFKSERTVVDDVQDALSGTGPKAVEREKPSARRKGSKSFPAVDLYTTTWCGYCRQAKAYLQQNGVPFNEYDVERNTRAAKVFREINPRGGVPVAVIGGRTVHGFSPAVYGQALGL